MKTPATDPATKQRALQIARQHSAAEAERQTGVKAATIRSWRRREGEAGPPSGADPTEWARAMREDAEQAAEAGRRALKQAQRLINEGQAHKAKEMAMAAGILIDKANHLEARALTVENRNVQVADLQARLLVEVLDTALRAVGLPPRGGALARLMRELLVAASGASGSITEGDDRKKLRVDDLQNGQAAKVEVRATLRREVEAEIRSDLEATVRGELIAELQAAEREHEEEVLRRQRETPQLPAPDPAAESGTANDDTEATTWAGPVRRVQTVPPSGDVIEGSAEEVPSFIRKRPSRLRPDFSDRAY